MKIKILTFLIVSTLSLSGCQTNIDDKFHYLDPKKNQVIICLNNQDAINLSKRSYYDKSKITKLIALAPKIKDKSCLKVDKTEVTIVNYKPVIRFRLSDETIVDRYSSPIYELKKVEYKNIYYWLVK